MFNDDHKHIIFNFLHDEFYRVTVVIQLDTVVFEVSSSVDNPVADTNRDIFIPRLYLVSDYVKRSAYILKHTVSGTEMVIFQYLIIRAGGHSPPLTDSGRGVFPPEFGIFCSYFQSSFSIACLRERNPSEKQEKYLS